MSNPLTPPLPLPDDDRAGEDGATEPAIENASRDIADAVTDADAEGTAAEKTQPVPAGRAGADSGAADAVSIDPDDEAAIPDSSAMNDEPGVGPGRPRP